MNKRGQVQGLTMPPIPPRPRTPVPPPAQTPTHVWIVIGALIVFGLIDFFFSSNTYSVLAVTAFFGIFGIIHFFSPNHKWFLGLLPLILAVTTLPGALGGASFLGMLASVPVLNLLVPPSITRLIIVFVIAVLYFFFTPKKSDYNAAYTGANTAMSGVQWKGGVKKIIWWVLIVAIIYGFEVSGGLADMVGIGAMYGELFVGLALIVFGLVMFSRKTAIDVILGVVSIILALFSMSTLIGIDNYFNWIPGIADLLPGYPIRYLFIAVLVADLVFREKVK